MLEALMSGGFMVLIFFVVPGFLAAAFDRTDTSRIQPMPRNTRRRETMTKKG